jgi:hypothetical protein
MFYFQIVMASRTRNKKNLLRLTAWKATFLILLRPSKKGKESKEAQGLPSLSQLFAAAGAGKTARKPDRFLAGGHRLLSL